MAITDEQVAALEALLSGRTDEHKRRLDQFDPAEANRGYSALVAAGCLIAIERQFIRNGKYVPHAEVIDHVATLRASSQVAAEVLDPDITERIILAGMDQGDLDDIDGDIVFGHQLFLLATLIAEEHLNVAELNDFLAEARETADRWLTQ